MLAQGIRLAVQFGWRPLEEMTLMAELLEHEVYEHGSLSWGEGSLRFTLRNPPLRMGAFSELRLWVDGTVFPPGDVEVAVEGAVPRTVAGVGPASPLVLPTGRRTRFAVRCSRPVNGPHRVRLELQSVAIPPTVWFEFTDHLREASA